MGCRTALAVRASGEPDAQGCYFAVSTEPRARLFRFAIVLELIENLSRSLATDPEPLGELVDERVLFLGHFVVRQGHCGGGQGEAPSASFGSSCDFFGYLVQAQRRGRFLSGAFR